MQKRAWSPNHHTITLGEVRGFWVALVGSLPSVLGFGFILGRYALLTSLVDIRNKDVEFSVFDPESLVVLIATVAE